MVRALKFESSVLVMDGNFVASREAGKWVSGSLYDHFELSEFQTVRDVSEAEALLKEARKSLSIPEYSDQW